MGGKKLQAPPLQHLWEVTAATHLRTGWPEEHRAAATLSWGRRGDADKGLQKSGERQEQQHFGIV